MVHSNFFCLKYNKCCVISAHIAFVESMHLIGQNRRFQYPWYPCSSDVDDNHNANWDWGWENAGKITRWWHSNTSCHMWLTKWKMIGIMYRYSMGGTKINLKTDLSREFYSHSCWIYSYTIISHIVTKLNFLVHTVTNCDL